MESPEAAEGRRGGDERGARWGKEECGYGRSRTSPSRTGPAKPDRDHEKRAKRRPRGPTACARASAPHLCSRHSPNRCLRGFPPRFPARVSPVRRERFLLSSGENVFLLFRISSLLSSSSRDLASSTDGILIGSRIGQSSERNELVGTKRSCLKIARGDYCFFFFSFFLFSFHRWWQWWWWSTKLENFLANKFNIVKKKSVRINEYRFLRPINLASLRKRIGSNISLKLVVDFSYHWSTASFRISSRWKISRERDYLAARRIRKVTYSSAKIFGTFTNVPCLSPDFLSWLKNVEIYWIRYPRFFFLLLRVTTRQK